MKQKDQFGQLTQDITRQFQQVVGQDFVHLNPEWIDTFSKDYTEDLAFKPDVVIRPASTSEVSEILKICNEQRIPVTAAGGRTGLSGGMLAVYGGVILSTSRLNKIISLDERNLQATLQPGVINETFANAVAELGLMYPVDPASKGSCFMGGNLAESSGGVRAVKYGTTRNYVLELEVVLASGEVIRTGSKTLKNSTGYNLTQLMVGSEGTLGIITEATFKLIHKPRFRNLMAVPFCSAEDACDAVSEVFRAGVNPSAIEFVEKEAIDFGQSFIQEFVFDTSEMEALILIELDGNEQDKIFEEGEKVFAVLEKYQAGEVLFAESVEEQERIWKIRRSIGEATRAGRVVKEEDTCVPRAELAKLWRFIKETAQKYDLKAFCFGHAGDGNLHVHILKPPAPSSSWEENAQKAIREIFTFTVELGGTLSGEHGIGYVQKSFMEIQFSSQELNLMKGIKQVFDPNGILNPGKIFPDNY